MKVGLAGPASPQLFRRYFPSAVSAQLPQGLGGTPVNLLAMELLRLGHEVTIFTLDPGVVRPVKLNGDGLCFHIGPFRRRRSRMLDAFRVERQALSSAMRESRVDLVNSHWAYEYALAGIDSGHPCLITSHDAPWAVLRYDPSAYRVLRLAMARKAISQGKSLSAVSPYVAQHLERFFGPKTEVAVIPNGMPDTHFSAAQFVERKGVGVTFATVLMGWGGRKNGRAALQAFSIFRKQIPNSRLIMFGAGHGEGEPAHEWALRAGLHCGVEFVGQTAYKELQSRLRDEVDILVHPALEEAHPMVLIEAIAQGVPVIAGAGSGGVPWTLGEGAIGQLVDVRSPQAISAAMIDLATNAPKAVDTSRRAWQYAKQRFGMQGVVQQYLEAYRASISTHG